MDAVKCNTPRLFTGHAPKRGQNICRINGFNLWVVGKGSFPWARLKLVAMPGTRLPKANFWLGWSVTDERLADGKDAKRLQADYPAVYEQVKTACRTLIDPDSIPKRNSSTMDQAELQRLRVDLVNAVARLDMVMGGGA